VVFVLIYSFCVKVIRALPHGKIPDFGGRIRPVPAHRAD
jgi:hypothetical protein